MSAGEVGDDDEPLHLLGGVRGGHGIAVCEGESGEGGAEWGSWALTSQQKGKSAVGVEVARPRECSEGEVAEARCHEGGLAEVLSPEPAKLKCPMIGTHSAAGYDMLWTGWVITVAGGNWRVRHEQAVEMDGKGCETAGNGVDSSPPAPCLGECGVTIRHQEKPSTFHYAQLICSVAPCGRIGNMSKKRRFLFRSILYALSSTRCRVRARIRCYPSSGAVSSWQVGSLSSQESRTSTTSGPDTEARVSLLRPRSVGFKNS